MGLCWSWSRASWLFGRESVSEQNDPLHNAGENVHLITTVECWEDKLSEASRDGKIVVANFSASWCGPCKGIAPVYSDLADKYPSLIFLTLDVDDLADLSTSWDITATPTFFFLKDGKQILDKLVGANKAELQKKTTAAASSR
ncbi:thioredoxin H4-1-like [Impatiens glandulifera]|uniref:thioredoxin H4-1-like n=1 Tax=Impatiens glandulifera TaxID=253017 RepID=UPI001FB0F010|nr:thioredoxin H4-1-like [Impatiens glandulifera]XP_047316164.1 thioredoxin H4-1-like [Impatiens glandulifera]XP_047316165.1 thioredoxin H4-1-like [Impatiens glandulifera]